LVYLLQDSQIPEIKENLGFTLCKLSVLTVYEKLKNQNGLGVLKDDLIILATMEIIDDKIKTRREINREIKMKENAIDKISSKYANNEISKEEIELILYSIGDYNSYLNSTMSPIDKMIQLLKKYFSQNELENGFSLKIYSGENGARLNFFLYKKKNKKV
jgi:hypothetical protein